jgi:hypothetical protein
MRFRGCQLPNRKSGCFARISARSRHSVYPAISQNDNHWRSKHEGHPVQRRVASRHSVVGVIPRESAIHYGGSGIMGRWPIIAGPPTPIHAQTPPAPKPWTVRTVRFKGFLKSQRQASAALATERGRRRTRQDQTSLGALGPVKLRTRDPHRTKKTCFFCRTGFLKERTLQKDDPAV